MLSMPPATTMSADPATIRSCASIAAFIAEPHILLTVVQPAASGTPALSEACRAGAWPCPAGSTLPMITSPTSPGLIPARSIAALIATAPRSLAASDAKSPRNAPIGVRAAPTMTIGSFSIGVLLANSIQATARSRAFAHGFQRQCDGHFVSLKSSRPISIRRISDVPAPIS